MHASMATLAQSLLIEYTNTDTRAQNRALKIIAHIKKRAGFPARCIFYFTLTNWKS